MQEARGAGTDGGWRGGINRHKGGWINKKEVVEEEEEEKEKEKEKEKEGPFQQPSHSE